MTADNEKCRKCSHPMIASIATGQTFTQGMDDFGPNDSYVTCSIGGPGAIIPARKCNKCGWSVTA